jgi:mevalonate kinase
MQRLNSKILLFGEYSVLHNSMALVLPCDRYSGQLNFCTDETDTKYAVQSNEYLKKFSGFIASHVDENFVLEVKQFEREIQNGLFFQSNIPQGYGLGSSGALVVAIFLRYLKKAKGVKDELKGMTIEKVQKLRQSLGHLESFFHGTSSGLDPLSIILNEPILYKNHHEVITTKLPTRDENGKNVVFLLNTGIARSTLGLMNRFHQLYKDPKFRDKFNNDLVKITDDSINSFLNNQSSEFYQSLDKLAQFQLEEMSYLIPTPFEKLAKQGLKNGDYFLKLCGAGGGGFMLGYTENWEKTTDYLKDFKPEIIYRY